MLIARALSSTAKIIILDEPTNGLDPNIASQVYEQLYRINKKDGITVIMVSHDVTRALDYADRVVQITQGKITFNDTPSKYNLGGKK